MRAPGHSEVQNMHAHTPCNDRLWGSHCASGMLWEAASEGQHTVSVWAWSSHTGLRRSSALSGARQRPCDSRNSLPPPGWRDAVSTRYQCGMDPRRRCLFEARGARHARSSYLNRALLYDCASRPFDFAETVRGAELAGLDASSSPRGFEAYPGPGS